MFQTDMHIYPVALHNLVWEEQVEMKLIKKKKEKPTPKAKGKGCDFSLLSLTNLSNNREPALPSLQSRVFCFHRAHPQIPSRPPAPCLGRPGFPISVTLPLQVVTPHLSTQLELYS